MNTASPISFFGPTVPEQRIESLDILRGFALFGILWMNMPRGGQGGLVSSVANWMCTFLAQGKFITIFGFLFGTGFALQWIRSAKQGRGIVALWLRRLLVLFLIGVCHCVFVWDGDILTDYALFGAYLLAVHRLPQKAILVLAVVVYATFLVSDEVAFTRRIARETGAVEASRIDPARLRERRKRMLAREAAYYATVSYPQLVRDNWDDLRTRFGGRWRIFLPGHVFVLFLLGLWSGRRGILQDSRSHARFLRRFVFWGLPAALTLCFGQSLHETLISGGHISWLGGSALRIGGDIGQRVLGLTYAAAILLLLQSEQWCPRLTQLKWAGRMALTNYLMQSVAFNAVAYGYGLGMYSKITDAIALLYSVVFFVAQVWLSRWWLTRYRFGPVEWLWRSLTYGRPQPWRASFADQHGAAMGS